MVGKGEHCTAGTPAPARALPAPRRGDEGGGDRERRDLALGDAVHPREGAPLFLQSRKRGRRSSRSYAGRSVFENHGPRVINGYRLLRPASDTFLGWTAGRPKEA